MSGYNNPSNINDITSGIYACGASGVIEGLPAKTAGILIVLSNHPYYIQIYFTIATNEVFYRMSSSNNFNYQPWNKIN